jgi:TonB family protein
MSLMVKVFEVGLRLVLLCAVALFVRASVLPQQEPDRNNATQPGSPTPAPAIDFEVTITQKQGVLVRRKGTQEWIPSLKLSEATAVGLLDGDHPIYVVTKAIKPPKAKRMPDPDYPKGRKQGEVLLHIVVDEHGAVRLPAVDASSSPAFAAAAVEAVKNWTFEPGKLSGQPVAVLIKVEMAFRLF